MISRLVGLLLLAACAGPAPTRDFTPAPEQPLPPAPPGHLVGDGHGPTPREAELDARRAVIEQIEARLETRTEAEESEHNVVGSLGQGERRVAMRTTSHARFEHAELLKTLAILPGAGGHRARVVLDRVQGARVYSRDVLRTQDRFRVLAPLLQAGLETLDTAVLLSGEWDALVEKHHRAVRILATMEQPTGLKPPEHPDRARLTALRRRTAIRLQVSGPNAATLRDGVVAALSRAFRARGCPLDEAPFLPPAADQPVADAVLTLEARRFDERGLRWLDLGLDLRVVDARSGRSVLVLAGLPRIVHAGGAGDAQAEQAALRRLDEVLEEKFGETLAGLDCR